MNVFIAEDEPPARERLVETLGRVAPGAIVVGSADSVRGTSAWLAAHPAPDLLLLDIQLSDGLSLELFRDGRLELPVIFTTAYDRFAIDAFQAMAVDYLLKPVSEDALAQALAKWQRLRAQVGANIARWLASSAPRWRQRLVGRKGTQHHALAITQVAYVVSVDKLAFAVTLDGSRYLLEQTLADLETELDPARFFRVSRQLLVAAHAVRQYASAGKGRIRLQLHPAADGEVLVSQERAGAFKAWLEHAPATGGP
jgi:DNA-binding LytR/AlgR family response regulator